MLISYLANLALGEKLTNSVLSDHLGVLIGLECGVDGLQGELAGVRFSSEHFGAWSFENTSCAVI